LSKRDEYNKKKYVYVGFRLKQCEKEKLDKVLKKYNLSRRKFILKVIEREECK